MAEHLKRKAKSKGKSYSFPHRLSGSGYDSHYQAKQAGHYSQGILFGKILFHSKTVYTAEKTNIFSERFILIIARSKG